jgi:U4/U6 small nuclear ribonucleoprotein PRP31
MLASKSALTARVDACRTHPKGDEGERMREQIIERYQKISAPGQSKLAKILPKPDDKPRKKRGGAKYRNMKLKYAMTMQRKLENTMAFGPEAQQEHAETGKGFGLRGMAGGLKVATKDTKILKKKPLVPTFGQQSSLMGDGASMLGAPKGFSNNVTNAGLVSSVAMTPMQGMELINPDLLAKKC